MQDRVSDHRLGQTLHGVEEFLSGGSHLEALLTELQAWEEAKALDTLTHRLKADS